VAAAGLAEELLRRCPALTVVATSRESLELPGEAVFRVGELSLPPARRAPTAAEVVHSDAVRLFVERAAASAPGFALTDDNAPHVAAICAHLDGIPLAIELAARRVRLFGPAEIRSRLADRFRLLTAGPRTAASRHRDLRTTIEWSYDLLEPVEQAAFRRLSVLVGGFGLAIATAVCEAAAAGAEEMFDLLSALEARSLVVPGAVNGAGSGRFRQLESIRLYGLDRLRASGEEDTTYDRLADHLLGLAEPVVGEGMLHCYEELEPLYVERANLQALLDWTGRRRDRRHLALVAALGRCWREQGYVSDAWALLRTALDAADPDHPDRAAALVGAASTVSMGGDHPLAVTLGTEAVRLEEARGHPVRLAKALGTLASVHVTGGERELAYRVSRRALDVAPLLTDPLDLSVCLHNEAYHMLQAGHPDVAGELMERCLPLYREHSPYPLPPEWLHSAGMLALARDEVDIADQHFREALDRYPRGGRAEDLTLTAIDSVEGLAAVAARQGRFVRALRLDAVAEAARRERKLGREATIEQQRDDTLAAARAGLTADQVRDAERDGSALAVSGAVEYAVSDRWAGHDEAGPPLSDRETELARLVAAGLTNRQIASRLRLTERAVEAGLRDVRTVLGLRSRAQLAAWSAEHLG
jgi:predicted ATPase/DNA-binding NarL/FixJ family response regulator